MGKTCNTLHSLSLLGMYPKLPEQKIEGEILYTNKHLLAQKK